MNSSNKIITEKIGAGLYGEIRKEPFNQTDKSDIAVAKKTIKIGTIKNINSTLSQELIQKIKDRISQICKLYKGNFGINLTRYYDETESNDNSISIKMDLYYCNIIQFLKDKKPTNKGLDIGEIYDVFSQLNSVFNIIAYEKIKYGNFKLENILVNPDKNEYILSGFEIIPELVKYAKEQNPEKICQYLPPELLEDGCNFQIEESTDLWSIGVVMYYLYFNEFPFPGKSCKEVLDAINSNNRKRTKFSDLDNLIDGLLTKDKGKRLTWKDYLNHKFFKSNGFWINYKNLEELGKGTFSTVYKALNKKTGQYDAIKIIDFTKIEKLEKNKMNRNEIKKELENRIDYLNKLYRDYPSCLIEIYEKFEIENGIAYSMELYKCNLKKYINTYPKDRDIFFDLIKINRCLKNFAREKIIIGNLKLENILLKAQNEDSNDYIFKLSDVGFYPKLFELIKKTSQSEDILNYIPPELSNNNNYEIQSDLWSLGSIIHYFKYKDFLYKECSFIDIINKINSGSVKLKSCTNGQFNSLLEGLLEKEPKKRLSWDSYFNHKYFIDRQYSEYYELGEPFSEGAYYKIYNAKDKKNQNEKVIKIVKKEQIRKRYYAEKQETLDEKLLKQLIKQLAKQTEIMKSLENNGKNENTVQFYEYFNTQNEFAIVMEKCDSNLNEYFIEKREDSYTLEEIKELLQQLNNTFKIMYKNNIIHGDLKLENILIKEENDKKIYKLTDYGMNKEFLSLTENLMELNGAPKYTAPEILSGGSFDKKSDLWSLGVIIYILFFREYPYKGSSEAEVLNDIKINGRKNLKLLSKDLQFDHLIRSLLTINPEDRITWEEYFDHPFLTGGDCWKFYTEPELLAEGSYFKMKKVKSTKRKSDQYKAVKVINLNKLIKKIKSENPKANANEELKKYINDFIQETENMELLRGPNRENKNSVFFYEYFQTKEEFCIVEEMYDENLNEYKQKKNKFNAKEIYQILNQLNNSFRIIKENNLSHKDLKLEKIVIIKGEKEDDNIYKLAGFEFNKRVDKLLRGGSFLSNERYRAPELLNNEIFDKNISEKDLNLIYQKADIWSLGIIIYLLYFGEFPFKGNKAIDVLDSIKKNETRINEVDDSDLKDLLKKMLTYEKNNRIDWECYFKHKFFANDKWKRK